MIFFLPGALLARTQCSHNATGCWMSATSSCDDSWYAWTFAPADAELRQRNRTLDGSNQQKMAAEAGSTSSSSSSSNSSGSPDVAEQRIPVSDAVLEQREYYLTVQVAYVIGLLTAFAANSITHMGQPALLYIVPCTLGAIVLKGASRAELSKLYSFTDVPSYGVGTLNFDEQKKLDVDEKK
eukprot:1147501-Pelagomonas_calceolata.AAC.1